jgi:hypothetical protein
LELQGDSSFAANIKRYHVADKSCGLLLGFFEHLLIARHEPARALRSFQLASMLNEARAGKAGDLLSTRRKGIITVATKG